MARAITGAAILFTAQTKPAEEGFQRMRHKSRDFSRNLDAARNHTRQFGSEVTGFSGRASQQFGGIVGDLDRVAGRTGSAAEAFRQLGNQAGVAGRVIGSGGAFGVAIAAGLGLANQMRSAIEEVNSATEKLVERMDELTKARRKMAEGMDASDFRKQRQEALEVLRELEKQRDAEFSFGDGMAGRAADFFVGAGRELGRMGGVELPADAILRAMTGGDREAAIAQARQQMAHAEQMIALRKQEAAEAEERDRQQSRRRRQLEREISQQMEAEQAAIAAGRKARERAAEEQRQHWEGMKSSAAELEKSLRTPFERAVDDVRELREMMRTLGPAFLSPETVGRRMDEIRQQIRDMVESDMPSPARERGVGGVRLGEAAGFSALQEARRNERAAGGTQQQQVSILKRVEQELSAIREAVESAEAAEFDVVDMAR